MTNEEFDEILERTNAVVCNREWYKRAVKALEQEPCEDCVSRAEVFEIMGNLMSIPYDFDRPINKDDVSESMDEIRALPSVTPTQRWIPVSERLPEEMGTYMTTIDYGEHGLVTGQRYYYGRGLKWNDECVIAWQPLPEPYKAEIEVEE